jgi:hypothetical protein
MDSAYERWILIRSACSKIFLAFSRESKSAMVNPDKSCVACLSQLHLPYSPHVVHRSVSRVAGSSKEDEGLIDRQLAAKDIQSAIKKLRGLREAFDSSMSIRSD